MTHLIVPITPPVVNGTALAYKLHVHMRIAAFPHSVGVSRALHICWQLHLQMFSLRMSQMPQLPLNRCGPSRCSVTTCSLHALYTHGTYMQPSQLLTMLAVCTNNKPSHNAIWHWHQLLCWLCINQRQSWNSAPYLFLLSFRLVCGHCEVMMARSIGPKFLFHLSI